MTVSSRLDEKALGMLVGGIARARHRELMEAGRLSRVYRRFVDGQEGVPEEDVNVVQPGGGEILYEGAGIAEAVAFCYEYCRELSPVVTGEFRNAWIVIVDGRAWQGNMEDIEGETALVVNYAPFARKLEQTLGLKGAHWSSKSRQMIRAGGGHPGRMITLMAAAATKENFKGLRISRRFVEIPGGATGTHWPVPYRRQTPPRITMLYPAVEIINAKAE